MPTLSGLPRGEAWAAQNMPPKRGLASIVREQRRGSHRMAAAARRCKAFLALLVEAARVLQHPSYLRSKYYVAFLPGLPLAQTSDRFAANPPSAASKRRPASALNPRGWCGRHVTEKAGRAPSPAPPSCCPERLECPGIRPPFTNADSLLWIQAARLRRPQRLCGGCRRAEGTAAA